MNQEILKAHHTFGCTDVSLSSHTGTKYMSYSQYKVVTVSKCRVTLTRSSRLYKGSDRTTKYLFDHCFKIEQMRT